MRTQEVRAPACTSVLWEQSGSNVAMSDTATVIQHQEWDRCWHPALSLAPRLLSSPR